MGWMVGTSFQTNADSLAAGCLLCGYGKELASLAWYGRLLRSKLFCLIPLAVVACSLLLSAEDAAGYAVSRGRTDADELRHLADD